MAVGFVQSKGGTSNTLSSLPIAFTSNNTAGNLLVCSGVVNTSTIGGLTITDTQGNTWTIVIVDNWKALSTFFMAYAQNCNAGANTVTIAQLGSLISGAISEYSGISPAASLDVSGFSDSGSGTWTAATSGNVTTRENGELIVAAQGNSTGPASVTLGSGFSNLQNDSGNFVSIESQVQATAGAIAGTFTISASSGACGVLTFVPPADAQPFNAWTPQGNVVANPSTIKLGNPSVIPGITGVVLSGTVFGGWFGDDINQTVYYYESVDGLTNWTAYSGNPFQPASAIALNPTVYLIGSTYFMYAGNQASNNGIALYTASTPTGPWTAHGIVIPLGGVGAWDHNGCFQLNIVDTSAATLTAYYSGYNGVQYGQGLATSTDGGFTWTKSVSNPIFAGPIGNSCFLKVGNVYYMYAPIFKPVAALNNNYSLGRWSAPAPSGPWTALQFSGTPVNTYYLATATELNNSTSLPQNGPNDQRIVVANGNIYMYYTLTGPGGLELSVNAAVATGFTPAQLVASYEGVVGVPFTGTPQINLNTLASDNFQRANVNPLGGNWSPVVAGKTSQIVSHIVNTSATGQGDSYWSGLSWVANPNQWSQSTINNETVGSFLGANCRSDITGINTGYRLLLSNGTSASSVINPTKLVAGTQTNLATLDFTITPGDTLMYAVNGTSVLTYWNGYLINVASDSAITAGAPGIQLFSATSTANAGISAWSGGTFQDAPLLSASISGNAGAGGVTVTYSGASSGSVVADSFGNYILPNLVNGSYTITPSLTGYTFSPSSSNQTVSGTNITGVNFTATPIPVTGHYSVPDARNYGNFPNLSTNVNGTLTYTVPKVYSLKYWFDVLFNRTQPLPEDCRAAGAPVASGTYPQNSRAPGVYGPGE